MKNGTILKCVVICCCVVAAYGQSLSGYEALIQQGKAQLQAGHADEALATGEQAIKLDARNWEGYALAGGALMNLKRYDEAINRLTDAIERAPQDKQAGLSGLRRQCFAAESGNPPPSSASAPAAASSSAPEATTTQAEIVLWKTIENSTNPEDFQTYLNQYPNGAFAAMAQRRLNETKQQAEASAEDAKAQQAAAAWQKTGLEAAKVGKLKDGTQVILLPNGTFAQVKHHNPEPMYGIAAVDQYQGQPALSFDVGYYCIQAKTAWMGFGVGGVYDVCSSGKIYVTDQNVAYQSNKGKLEFSSPRSAVAVKDEGGRQGDTFSVYDDQGKRYRFGSPKFDSPYMMFLQAAIADFPTTRIYVQDEIAKAQAAQAANSASSAGGTK